MDIMNPTRCTLSALEKAFIYSSLSNTLLSHSVIHQDMRNYADITFKMTETMDLLEKLKDERTPPSFRLG
jgi:hypothetical protein